MMTDENFANAIREALGVCFPGERAVVMARELAFWIAPTLLDRIEVPNLEPAEAIYLTRDALLADFARAFRHALPDEDLLAELESRLVPDDGLSALPRCVRTYRVVADTRNGGDSLEPELACGKLTWFEPDPAGEPIDVFCLLSSDRAETRASPPLDYLESHARETRTLTDEARARVNEILRALPAGSPLPAPPCEALLLVSTFDEAAPPVDPRRTRLPPELEAWLLEKGGRPSSSWNVHRAYDRRALPGPIRELLRLTTTIG